MAEHHHAGEPETRRIAIIGAGIAGATAALVFRDAGFEVTLYSDRSRAALRDEVPPTGVAIIFGRSRESDAEIIEDLYPQAVTTGLSARLYAGSGDDRQPVLEFDPEFGFQAQAVDVRLRADDRIGRFLDRGGRLVIEPVDADRLDEIAAESDLTLVATGKAGLAGLFEVDRQRSVYSEPQRRLQVTLTGLDQGPEVFAHRSGVGGAHNTYNFDTENGEAWLGPFFHKDEGLTWSFLGFAKPDGAWAERFDAVTDTASARDTVVELYRDFFPEDAPEVERLTEIADPYSWLRGAVTPVVRRPVGRTRSGHVVAALGDTAIAVDPVAAQGAQNALVQVAELVKAARTHRGGFDEAWITDRFEEHWQRRGAGSVELSRLFLGDPDYTEHRALAFPAAAVDERVAVALVGLLSDPNPLLGLRTADDVRAFIEAVTGEPARTVLDRFTPAGEFGAAAATAPA